MQLILNFRSLFSKCLLGLIRLTRICFNRFHPQPFSQSQRFFWLLIDERNFFLKFFNRLGGRGSRGGWSFALLNRSWWFGDFFHFALLRSSLLVASRACFRFNDFKRGFWITELRTRLDLSLTGLLHLGYFPHSCCWGFWRCWRFWWFNIDLCRGFCRLNIGLFNLHMIYTGCTRHFIKVSLSERVKFLDPDVLLSHTFQIRQLLLFGGNLWLKFLDFFIAQGPDWHVEQKIKSCGAIIFLSYKPLLYEFRSQSFFVLSFHFECAIIDHINEPTLLLKNKQFRFQLFHLPSFPLLVQF